MGRSQPQTQLLWCCLPPLPASTLPAFFQLCGHVGICILWSITVLCKNIHRLNMIAMAEVCRHVTGTVSMRRRNYRREDRQLGSLLGEVGDGCVFAGAAE